ncbi:hypothetical protein ACIP5N_30510 [Streptomyces sp. NPDC088768]|uniref:LppU/SCO3897 family protein n=1 Tax=Streptomyces sp. NPDC088768 TaxID=3365894 RepID=UPI00380CEB25
MDDSPGSARVGDCVHLGNGPLAADPGPRVVPCESAEATYEVSESPRRAGRALHTGEELLPPRILRDGLAGFTLRLRTHDTGADPAPAPAPGIPG